MIKKVIGLFKDEFEEKIMKEYCALRAKTYANLIDDNSEYKRAKGTKKRVMKRRLMFENYTNCLFNNKTTLRPQQVFRSDHHNQYTVKINKIAPSSNDDKRLQAFDGVTTYPHGTNVFKVRKREMLKVCEAKVILKILSKEFESEIYVKETGKCEMFLKYVKEKCESGMQRYVKVKMQSKYK